jgi:hypothetical protein
VVGTDPPDQSAALERGLADPEMIRSIATSFFPNGSAVWPDVTYQGLWRQE